MKRPTVSDESTWHLAANQILRACRPLADRVIDEGAKLMLTDTDWAVLQGFEIVIKRADQIELTALSVAAGISRSQFDAMLDLYNLRKKR